MDRPRRCGVIKALEQQMYQHARDLEFEDAARSATSRIACARPLVLAEPSMGKGRSKNPGRDTIRPARFQGG